MWYIHPLTNDVEDVVVVNCSKQRTFSGLSVRGHILQHIWLEGEGEGVVIRYTRGDLCARSLYWSLHNEATVLLSSGVRGRRQVLRLPSRQVNIARRPASIDVWTLTRTYSAETRVFCARCRRPTSLPYTYTYRHTKQAGHRSKTRHAHTSQRPSVRTRVLTAVKIASTS